MFVAICAIAIFIFVFAVATIRNVHLGILIFPVACGVGVLLAGMPLKEVIGGFPVSIMVLLVGVTYFFGIAQVNGTIDRVIRVVLSFVGDNPVVLPFIFFALSGGVSAMGSPIAGLVLAPVAMPIAKRTGVDSALMALAISSGISAGAFAPTSLFGIVTYGTAHGAGIDLNPFTLFAIAVAANLVLLLAAFPLSGRAGKPQRMLPSGTSPEPVAAVASAPKLRFERSHVVTTICMIGLVLTVIVFSILGIDPDIGVIAFVFAALVMLIYPAAGTTALSRIDWSTVLLVGGIITYVGVLQKVGAVDLLGEAAKHIGTPFVASLVVCAIAALASAFASTTGILAALVPLAVPLAKSGNVTGWALISALGICASIVDISPFSTIGATLVASAAEEDRPRLKSVLFRWGLSMVVVGPAILGSLLLLLTRL